MSTVKPVIAALIIPPYITSTIFHSGKDFNSKYFRIPHIITTKGGTIVVGADIRYNGSSDFGRIDQCSAISTDGGKTWSYKQIIMTNNNITANSRAMDSTMIYNAQTNKIFVFTVKLDDDLCWYDKIDKKNWDMVYVTSSDDGKTWSKEISVKNVIGSFSDRILFLGGVGSGIVMNNGTMVLPIQASNKNSLYKVQSGFIYSTNNGVTWTMSQSLLPEYSNENNIVEYANGSLLINARSDGSGKRVLYKTIDMGKTWIPTKSNSASSKNKIVQQNGCMGSMIIAVINGSQRIYYSEPYNTVFKRSNPALMTTTDNGETWKVIAIFYNGDTSGYTGLSSYSNKLYSILEIGGNIIFKDITNLTK